ncbi:ATP-binding cassette domain-containing protein [Shewanella fidelis]|uniref:ATP-binding cassette domain-containing protein n=1 Tax=Shewanella fidelis TaxID=173509 RepID=UPI0004921972|nr:ATP-binding cassette domain-containing protein [Shewanella fidelis]
MLTIEHVLVEFGGKVALDIDSLTIKEGEKIAIVGRSGSGKTTLIHHIYDVLRSKAALCSQRQGLVENLSVFHNIYMGELQRHHWLYNLVNLVYPLPSNRYKVSELTTALELECPMTQVVANLSGGQRQRVALGRALYQKQQVFIGDEPFSALDPTMGRRLLRYVFNQHSTVIMALHDTSMALACFDRVIGLHQGKRQFDVYVHDICVDAHQDQLQALYEMSR